MRLFTDKKRQQLHVKKELHNYSASK